MVLPPKWNLFDRTFKRYNSFLEIKKKKNTPILEVRFFALASLIFVLILEWKGYGMAETSICGMSLEITKFQNQWNFISVLNRLKSI